MHEAVDVDQFARAVLIDQLGSYPRLTLQPLKRTMTTSVVCWRRE